MRNKETEGQPMPEPFRDIEEEMTQDDLIATLNNILTEKARNLEYIMDSFGDASSSQLKRTPFESFINNGKLLSSYNSLMRAYLKPTLAKSSKIVLANKIQQLEPLFKTIEYGIHQLIIDIYQRAPAKGIQARPTDILSLIKCEALYKAIKESIYQRSYKIIDDSVINFTIRDVVRGYPLRMQEKLNLTNDSPTPVFKYDLSNTATKEKVDRYEQQIINVDGEIAKIETNIATEEKELVGKQALVQTGKDMIKLYKDELDKDIDSKTGNKLDAKGRKARKNSILKIGTQIEKLQKEILQHQANLKQLNAELGRLNEQKIQFGKSI